MSLSEDIKSGKVRQFNGTDFVTPEENTMSLNEDTQSDESLVKAENQWGHALKTYDDGFGPLWIHRDSMGILGISRAMTWEEAYEISEDEFFCRVTDEEKESFLEEFECDTWEDLWEDGCFQEAIGHSPNNGMYHRDLNGESLDELTPELQKTLGLTLTFKSDE